MAQHSLIDERELQKSIQDAIKKLDQLPKEFGDKKKKDILTHAAQPVVNAARRLAPVSDKVHFTYDTKKVVKGIRAPKGQGQKKGTYNPGNLRDSIQVLTHGVFKKLAGVTVGPKFLKKGGKGTYGGGRKSVNAYYAAMVEFGTKFYSARPFMRPAWDSTKTMVLKRIEDGVTMVVQNWIKKNAK